MYMNIGHFSSINQTINLNGKYLDNITLNWSKLQKKHLKAYPSYKFCSLIN